RAGLPETGVGTSRSLASGASGSAGNLHWLLLRRLGQVFTNPFVAEWLPPGTQSRVTASANIDRQFGRCHQMSKLRTAVPVLLLVLLVTGCGALGDSGEPSAPPDGETGED